MSTNKNRSQTPILCWILYGAGILAASGVLTLHFFFNEKSNGWLFGGGLILCFLAFKLAFVIRPRRCAIKRRSSPDMWLINGRFRFIASGAFLLFIVGSIVTFFSTKTYIPTALEHQKEQASQQIFNTKHDALKDLPKGFKTNWTSFRGINGTATALGKKFPTQWSLEMGNGIKWKTKIPVNGFNAPIVWENRIFLTGGDKLGQEVFCFDSDNGELLWRKTIFSAQSLPEVSKESGFATPTMTTNGKLVFALFASGDLVALDFDGNITWKKNIGRPETGYGIRSSLISDGIRLFVQNDYKGQDKLVAFDATTGDILWSTPRKKISWASPSLLKIGGTIQLILIDNTSVISYEPNTGKQIWQIQCLEGEALASIGFDGKDILFIANKNAKPVALKISKTGAKILWQGEQAISATASPVASGNMLFIPTDSGKTICLDTQTGKLIWTNDFSAPFIASPIIANQTVYTFDTTGYAHLFLAEKTYREIATIKMNEPIIATPAFLKGRIYIRGTQHLFCLEK